MPHHGISSATFFKWKSKYGGMDVSDARKLQHCRGTTRFVASAGLVLVGVVVAIVVSAAAARAAWSAPADVSPNGQNADSHQVAIDADDHAVIVWCRSDGSNYRVQAVSRSASGAVNAGLNLQRAIVLSGRAPV